MPEERGEIHVCRRPAERGEIHVCRRPAERGAIHVRRMPAERGAILVRRMPAERGEIHVRRAVPGDCPSLAALAAIALEEPWSEAAFREELALAEARVWIAEDSGGGTLGYAVLRRVLDEAHLLSLAVDPARRRHGLGRALIRHALGHELGCRRVHLEVGAGNEPARAFYAALGFAAVGRRRRHYRNGEDALLLARSGPRDAHTESARPRLPSPPHEGGDADARPQEGAGANALPRARRRTGEARGVGATRSWRGETP